MMYKYHPIVEAMMKLSELIMRKARIIHLRRKLMKIAKKERK